jgi:hypothetical protein
MFDNLAGKYNQKFVNMELRNVYQQLNHDDLVNSAKQLHLDLKRRQKEILQLTMKSRNITDEDLKTMRMSVEIEHEDIVTTPFGNVKASPMMVLWKDWVCARV